MHRHLYEALGAAAVAAAFGLSACSPSQPKIASSSTPAALPPTSSPVAAAPTVPLPAPDALTGVLSRLADPDVSGSNKVNLIEGATPESAGTLDKFAAALRDNGYLPMTFVANDLAWSDKNPSNVTATIRVNTAKPDNGNFIFPMEFNPVQGGWQLSQRTAEILLALGNSAAPAPPPSPAAEPPSPTTPPG
ncbi:MAG: hypothetical protein PHQ28_03735 [Mycobacterium sp.]|nr:hypothetical protein [Mycobacterium sp.]